MVHHLGVAVIAGGLMAAFLLPPACNPLSSEHKAAQATAPAVAVREEAVTGAKAEDAAKRYLMDIYSRDPAEVRRALIASAGVVGVTDEQVSAGVTDNRTRPEPKEVVIARQEVQSAPPHGRSASIWFVLVRADSSTRAGRLVGWQKYGGNWTFVLAGY
ncbi:MAG: hypothetical protein FD131_4996 [Rhodocyclaceae bacterium]|nr:MAG: hypothetical protein FD131_4996 [Rhodocyclaceae bacterium]